MNKRLFYVFAFALIVSAAATLILYRLISRQMEASAKAPAPTVVVAARNLEVGAMVHEEDVKVVPWNGPAPDGALTKIDDAKDRGIVHPVFAGEPVLQHHLAAAGAGAGLAAIIPPGMRAVALRVNEVVGVSGFATPGMHVDVLVAGNPPGPATQQVGTQSRTLLQNIEVLSAGQNIQKDAEGKPVTVNVVNLLVTPEQAEILSLASSDARIQLVLRNPTDKETAKTTGTAMAYLFNGGAPVAAAPAPAAPAPKPRPKPVVQAPKVEPPPVITVTPEKVVVPITVEVIHGSKRIESKFPGEEAKPPEAQTAPQIQQAPPDVPAKVKGDGL